MALTWLFSSIQLITSRWTSRFVFSRLCFVFSFSYHIVVFVLIIPGRVTSGVVISGDDCIFLWSWYKHTKNINLCSFACLFIYLFIYSFIYLRVFASCFVFNATRLYIFVNYTVLKINSLCYALYVSGKVKPARISLNSSHSINTIDLTLRSAVLSFLS